MLSDRQRAFVEHYLSCWNSTEAARLAGYKNPNKLGPRQLVKVGVQDAIRQRLSELQAGTDEVLTRLASHSRATMEDFIGSMDRVDLDRARERGVMHLIKKIKQRTTTVSKESGEDVETHYVELELYDAQDATVQLARILGLYIERIEVNELREKADDELIAEFQSLMDTARARAGAGHSDRTTPTP